MNEFMACYREAQRRTSYIIVTHGLFRKLQLWYCITRGVMAGSVFTHCSLSRDPIQVASLIPKLLRDRSFSYPDYHVVTRSRTQVHEVTPHVSLSDHSTLT